MNSQQQLNFASQPHEFPCIPTFLATEKHEGCLFGIPMNSQSPPCSCGVLHLGMLRKKHTLEKSAPLPGLFFFWLERVLVGLSLRLLLCSLFFTCL